MFVINDFVQDQGLAFFAHLLKRLSDEFVDGCSEWFAEYGLIAPARTMSTIRALHELGPLSVTQLAGVIRQSHPMVINWLKLLELLGLVSITTDDRDRRKSIVSLTLLGRAEAAKSLQADQSIVAAYKTLFEEVGEDVFAPLWRMESACRSKNFAERLREAQKPRLKSKRAVI